MRSLLTFLLLNCLGFTVNAQDSRSIANGSFTCPVTSPSERVFSTGGNYGNESIATGLWKDGKVIFKPGGSGFVLQDGSLSMKFPWWRRVDGQLTIEGRRLDAPAPPLRSDIPKEYGDSGFQASAIIFPTPGCWEVTARVGQGQLTFVTDVVKVGAGPTPGHP
jgi:hypothetical protein